MVSGESDLTASRLIESMALNSSIVEFKIGQIDSQSLVYMADHLEKFKHVRYLSMQESKHFWSFSDD